MTVCAVVSILWYACTASAQYVAAPKFHLSCPGIHHYGGRSFVRLTCPLASHPLQIPLDPLNRLSVNGSLSRGKGLLGIKAAEYPDPKGGHFHHPGLTGSVQGGPYIRDSSYFQTPGFRVRYYVDAAPAPRCRHAGRPSRSVRDAHHHAYAQATLLCLRI